MQKLFLLLLAVVTVTSCNNDDDTPTPQEVTFIGNWKLIEMYAGPGGGSGTFEAVISDKTVTFNSNGEITSNYSLCSVSLANPQASSGTYTISGVIDIANCPNNSSIVIYAEISNTGNLIITYPCIDEVCQEKYEKVA